MSRIDAVWLPGDAAALGSTISGKPSAGHRMGAGMYGGSGVFTCVRAAGVSEGIGRRTCGVRTSARRLETHLDAVQLSRNLPGIDKSVDAARTPACAANAVQPVVIRRHDPPKRHPSALGDREGANLLCLNAYTSRERVPAGSVASVRVWALDDAGQAVALGQAPVESDGSFFVQTPADRGIRFELLDRGGKTVAAEKGWFWARRGEQRVCVGCHAGPERAPENAVPATLLRSTDPARMTLPVFTAKGGGR